MARKRRIIYVLLFWRKRPGPAVRYAMALNTISTQKGEVNIDMGEITVDAGGANLTGTVTFMDADGNPTTPDEVPTWSSSDGAVATVAEVSEDGLTAQITPSAAGAAIIEVLAVETADDGSTTDVVARGTVNVINRDETPDAVVGEVNFS